MKELSRFELAIIKRTAQNTKSLRTRKSKLQEKIEEAEKELTILNETIEAFEAPIRNMTGGYTSDEVLNGLSEEAINTEEVSEEIVEMKEVSKEEAVEDIDPFDTEEI